MPLGLFARKRDKLFKSCCNTILIVSYNLYSIKTDKRDSNWHFLFLLNFVKKSFECWDYSFEYFIF